MGDDGAGVYAAIIEHKLDATTRQLASVRECIGLRFGRHRGVSAKGGQERRVHVEDDARIRLKKFGREDTVIAREDYKIDLVLAKLLDERFIAGAKRLELTL